MLLAQNITSIDTCIHLNDVDDVILDCNNYGIIGPGEDSDDLYLSGIKLDDISNVTIQDCIIKNYRDGIF